MRSYTCCPSRLISSYSGTTKLFIFNMKYLFSGWIYSKQSMKIKSLAVTENCIKDVPFIRRE